MHPSTSGFHAKSTIAAMRKERCGIEIACPLYMVRETSHRKNRGADHVGNKQSGRSAKVVGTPVKIIPAHASSPMPGHDGVFNPEVNHE
jgi:hypothetical protein